MILEFENLSFKNPPGTTMITIRKGIKWFGKEKETMNPLEHKGIRMAKEINASDYMPNIRIRIFKTVLYRMKDIPIRWLREYHHDSACEDHKGLLKAMKRYYGDDFQEEEICTVVYFEVLK